MGYRRTSKSVFIFALCIVVVTSVAFVSEREAYCIEGGGNSYALGIFDVGAGIQLPPGAHFKQFFLTYSGNASIVEKEKMIQTHLHVNSFTSLTAFYQVTKSKIWGSYYGWVILLPVTDSKVSGEIVKPAGMPPSFTASRTSLGNVVIAPVSLGWHNGRSHQRVLFVVYTPLGSYNIDRLVNTGSNRWALELDYAFTFKDEKTNREFSSAVGYTVNFINPATDYLSGQEFHADIAAVQHFPTSLGLGLVGYAFVQTTADSGSGAKLGPFRGRAFALGPIAVYNMKIGDETLYFTGKYYQEFGVQNRFKGHTFWLNVYTGF